MNYEEKFKRLMKAHNEYKRETETYISDLKRELSEVAEIVREARETVGFMSKEVTRLDTRISDVREGME